MAEGEQEQHFANQLALADMLYVEVRFPDGGRSSHSAQIDASPMAPGGLSSGTVKRLKIRSGSKFRKFSSD